MDLKYDRAAGRLEDSTTEVMYSARVSARSTGQQMEKGSSGRGKHRGVTGSSKFQRGLVSTHVVVPTSEGKTGPPNQGGPGTSVSG